MVEPVQSPNGAGRPSLHPSTPPLLRLPPSLLAQIASHLPPPSARALSLTSRALHDPACSSSLHTLNLTLQRRFLPLPLLPLSSLEYAEPLCAKTLYAIRQQAIWGEAYPPEYGDHFETPRQRMDTYLRTLIAILQGRERYKHVRELHFDLDLLFSPRFADLLHLLKDTLRVLTFYPMNFQHPSSHVVTQAGYALLRLTDVLGPPPSQLRLEALTHLTIPLDEDWCDMLTTLLTATPNLQDLKIGSMRPYAGAWDGPLDFPPSPPHTCWPSLPKLVKLEVQEMDGGFLPFLAELVSRSAGRLEYVGLRDPTGRWRCEEWAGEEQLLCALRGLRGLKYLGVPPCWTGWLGAGGLGEGCERVSIMDDERRSYGASWAERVVIPPLPTMMCLYAHSHATPGHFLSHAFTSHPLGLLPAALHPLPPSFLAQLNAAPQLEVIQLPATYEQERHPSPVPDDYWGTPASHAAHDKVVLIRTYLSGRGERFTHCRMYTAHWSQVEEGGVVKAESAWEEFVDFEGVRVTGGTLGRVYEILGDDLGAGWTVPGRGLRLPEEAWEVLRLCRQERPRQDEQEKRTRLQHEELGLRGREASNDLRRETELMGYWDGPDPMDM